MKVDALCLEEMLGMVGLVHRETSSGDAYGDVESGGCAIEGTVVFGRCS